MMGVRGVATFVGFGRGVETGPAEPWTASGEVGPRCEEVGGA
jgi:hypothetical protein